MFVPGVCYGDTSNEMETEGNGMLHCKMGSLFAGRSSFHPGESHEGLVGVPSGLLLFLLLFIYAFGLLSKISWISLAQDFHTGFLLSLCVCECYNCCVSSAVKLSTSMLQHSSQVRKK